MDSPSPGLETLLARLAASGTELVPVGALAAVAQGAPLTTFDIDVVHRCDGANVDRLLAFLTSVDARYRGRPAGQVLRPAREALLGTRSAAVLHVPGAARRAGGDRGWARVPDLVREAIEVEVEGETVRVLGLRMLAELKRGATDAKGRLALAVIEETMRRSGGG